MRDGVTYITKASVHQLLTKFECCGVQTEILKQTHQNCRSKIRLSVHHVRFRELGADFTTFPHSVNKCLLGGVIT